MTKEELMRKAIELSIKSVHNGGGPFGAVIAREGEIIAEGSKSLREIGHFRPHRLRNLHLLRAMPYVPRCNLLGTSG